MPKGKGTYGSKVGRPPKKKTAKKKGFKKMANSIAKGMGKFSGYTAAKKKK
jgi:hypothetical protein